MNSIRRKAQEKTCGKRFADALLGGLLCVALGWGGVGCLPDARIHPDYGRLRPAVVAVPPVENETTHQLDEVSFGGPLQRTVIGVGSYNIPNLLRGALEEALVLHGYSVGTYSEDSRRPKLDFRRPLPPEAARQPFDAVLLSTIESWTSDKLSSSSMVFRFRVEMVRVPTAELLYIGVFECGHRGDSDGRGIGDDQVSTQIRRSAQRALASLPGASD